MTAKIIDGNALSATVRGALASRAAALTAKGVTPCLAVILVGEDPASQTYVAGKEKACKEVGFTSSVYRYDADMSEKKLFEALSMYPLP